MLGVRARAEDAQERGAGAVDDVAVGDAVSGPAGAELVRQQPDESSLARVVRSRLGKQLGAGLAAGAGSDVVPACGYQVVEVIYPLAPPVKRDVHLDGLRWIGEQQKRREDFEC